MASFYRNGTYVSDYIRSDGTYVSGHCRNGSHVNFEDHCSHYDPYVSETSNLFLTHCFDCNQEVYFVRNTTYFGCFLADQIEPDWIIHPCWEDKQFGQHRMEVIIQYYQRESSRIRHDQEKKARQEKETTDKEREQQKKLKEKTRQIIADLPLREFTEQFEGLYITGMVFGHISCRDPDGPLNFYIAEAYNKEFRFKILICTEDFFELKPLEINWVNVKRLKRANTTLLYLESDKFNMKSASKSQWTKTPGLVPRHLLHRQPRN
ncbi:hypothetical protein [Marinospirillum sp.]|uniref:hypothetical protein n=1 Tax=Marinospirillum sp. TaxID=2183934 RepID=UPI00384E9F72